jgi:hypothetical protein
MVAHIAFTSLRASSWSAPSLAGPSRLTLKVMVRAGSTPPARALSTASWQAMAR